MSQHNFVCLETRDTSLVLSHLLGFMNSLDKEISLIYNANVVAATMFYPQPIHVFLKHKERGPLCFVHVSVRISTG
jgi:hypothetical protein